MSNAEMLKQLRTSLKALDQAEKVQDKILNDLITKLPDDKRKLANDLISRARKGNVDMSEMMAFTSGIRDIDKKDIKKSVKRANAKKKEVTEK